MDAMFDNDSDVSIINRSRAFCAERTESGQFVSETEFLICIRFLYQAFIFSSDMIEEVFDLLNQFLLVVTQCRGYPNMTTVADYRGCFLEIGQVTGYCYSMFYTRGSYEMCVDLLLSVNASDRGSDVWKTFEVACASQNSNNYSQICNAALYLKAITFNATNYNDSPLSRVYHVYIYPVLAVFTACLNIVMATVLVKDLTLTCTSVFLISIAISETLAFLIPFPPVMYFFAFENYHDLTPYWLSILTITSLDILPRCMHSMSNLFMVGLAWQRVLVMASPLKYARNKTLIEKITIIYIIVITCLCSAVSIPLVVIECYKIGVEMASPVDNSNSVYTMLEVFPDDSLEPFQDLMLLFQCLILQVLPISLTICGEVKLILTTTKYIKQRRQTLATDNREKKIQRMTSITVIIVFVFLLAEIPNTFLAITKSLSVTVDIDVSMPIIRQIASIANILTQITSPCNYMICCCLSQEFRMALKARFKCG